MPIVASSFRPPVFLKNAHLQTVLPVILPRSIRLSVQSERMDLPDGDFLDLDWVRSGSDRIAIVTHGLEGSSRGGYIRGTAAALRDAGWDVLAWNFRGCGPEPNRLARAYHSGDTADLARLIEHAADRYSAVALVGFSLGGNVVLKYLGEGGVHPVVCAGAAVSVPVDLAASARRLDSDPGNRIYLRRFLRTLVKKIEEKATRFPDEFDLSGVRRISSFQEFDDRFTAPMHGFRDAMDYWERSSAKQFLPAIRVPALLLNAQDDPFLTPECFPTREAEGNPWLYLEMPPHGGHVGFLECTASGLRHWAESRIVQWLTEYPQRSP